MDDRPELTFLIYISRAISELDEKCLNEIAEKASANNLSLGITGLLLRSGDQIVQILEGPPQAVHTLLQKIGKDSRHTNLRVIHEESVTSRLFGKWSMNFYSLRGTFKQLLAESLQSENSENNLATGSPDLAKTVKFIKKLPDFFFKNHVMEK